MKTERTKRTKKTKTSHHGLFESDRRMELRLRLAAKRAADATPVTAMGRLEYLMPDDDLLGRLIERVRRL
jgi:hypothetical protein